MGVVSPIGIGLDDFAAGLKAGVSGIRLLQNDGSAITPPRVAGVVNIDFRTYLPPVRIPGLDRVSLLAMTAARLATQDAAHTRPPDLSAAGVYIGTGIGGVGALETAYEEFFVRAGARVKPLTVVQAMNNAPAAHIAMEYGCHGPALTYSTACSSSAMAIGEACRAIRHGYVDCALAGGTEAMLVPGSIRAWEALRTLAIPDAANAPASCRPFAKSRTGLVLAEGAAVLVLEEYEHARNRGARIYAVISGYGCRTDATHLTKPDAKGQAETMLTALTDAGLTTSDIGYINAHGTATQAGDVIETQAIKLAFGETAKRIPVSSTKSMHGHVMGATGAVEFIASVIALTRGFLPPTINLVDPDPECDLDYVPIRAREGVELRHVMSNSFAFGGSNAVLIASRLSP
jgi:3-oxoacyl-[acyl-carrier-protein] synthase II